MWHLDFKSSREALDGDYGTVESTSTRTDLFVKFDQKKATCGGLNCWVIMKYIQSRYVDNTWTRTLWGPLRLQPVVGLSVFLLVTSMEGFADYKEPLWNAGCLTSFPCCCGLLLICPTAVYVCSSLRWGGGGALVRVRCVWKQPSLWGKIKKKTTTTNTPNMARPP